MDKTFTEAATAAAALLRALAPLATAAGHPEITAAMTAASTVANRLLEHAQGAGAVIAGEDPAAVDAALADLRTANDAMHARLGDKLRRAAEEPD